MLLPQLDQYGLHIFCPNYMSYLHGTFILSSCPFGTVQRQKKNLGLGETIFAQLCQSDDNQLITIHLTLRQQIRSSWSGIDWSLLLPVYCS